MATTVTLRKVLDRKQWEMCATLFSNSVTNYIQSTLFDSYQFWVVSSNAWLYDPREDAFMGLGAIPITLSGGQTGLSFHPNGPTGTASAGGSSTITTVTTLPGSIAGYTIRITAGTGAGQERVIASNTYGANAVITVGTPWSTNPDNTSQYLLLTGRYYTLNGSNSPAFRYYDMATNAWSSALSTGGGLVTGAGYWAMASTPAYGSVTATGTATAGASTTLTNSGKAWAVNQWTNSQVRITSGTGAGQVRTVASNTATVLTVSSAFGTNPDATSVYALEPNDDYLYASGPGVGLYRYSISGNTWSLLSPGVARTGALAQLGSLDHITNASDATWADETSIKNGRYLYSFQGGGSANLSYYDIAANTWVNLTTTYQRAGGGAVDGLTSAYIGGLSYAIDREFIYLLYPGTSTSAPCWRYNCVTQALDPWATWNIYPSSVSVGFGRRSSVVSYTDGGTTIRWVYFTPNYGSAATVYRMMII